MRKKIRLSILLLLGAAACTDKRRLPELPRVELAGAEIPVRGVIESAYAAARATPNDAAAVARLGMSLHAHNELAGAAQAYERAAGLDAGQPDYYYYWGTVLAASGQYDEAIAPLRKSLKLRKATPVRLRLAEALYASGRIAEARREYEALIGSDDTLAAAHYGLGRCLQGAEAAAELQRAVQLFPRYGAARFALAGVYRQLGQPVQAEAALANYERDKLVVPPVDDPAMAAVQALDASTTGLLRASVLREREGRLEEAAALQERALGSDPKLIQAWVNLISLYARLGMPGKAEAAYRKAIAAEPNNAGAHYNFGVLCAQTERFEEAGRAFEAAVAADPNNADALDSLGAIVERSGAWDRAAALYRRALAANPSLRLARYHLGRIYANQRRYPEAIREFEQAIEPRDSQSGGFLYALGATHARAGDTAKAVEVLQRAREEAARWQQESLVASIDRDLGQLRGRR